MSETLVRFDRAPLATAATAWGALAVSAKNPMVFKDEDMLATVSGSARFTERGLTDLAARYGLAHALAKGYASRGTDVFALLSGSFAAAVLVRGNNEAALAVDRMGTRPLSYAGLGGSLAFGSTLDAIRAFPGMESRVDPQAIYDYVHFHMVPGPRTIYTGCRRLEAGHYLLWRDGHAVAQRYWQMRFVENRRLPFAELKDQFLDTVRESVREAAAQGNVGTFLSGGTDSSTIAGMLGQVTGKPARTYSIGFDAQGYDEMEYARIAARHFATDHHEYYVTPDDVVAAIPRVAAVHDQPFGNASAIPTYYCAKLARDQGDDVLLGGDGGDELFGGNTRYARQQVLSLYSDLPRLLRKTIEPIAFLLPEVWLLGKAQRYIRYASTPMPARYDDYNLLERIGPATVFTAEFLASIDAQGPARQMAETYDEVQARSLINRMLALDFKYTLADNDLPKVARSCELAGVKVRFPLLDDAVVTFSADLPPDLKLKRTKLRYFFKRALEGFLPEAILTKSKHGFGLPVGAWVQGHAPLRQLALDSLANLKKRGIVRPEFIDQLTSVHMRQHAEYYGNMVWILVMLEQWFAQRKASV